MKRKISLLKIGQKVVEELLSANEYRSNEIIAGIDGERFHTKDVLALVKMLTNNEASEELQVAALGHDVERFSVPKSGSGYVGRRTGPEYEQYKKKHAESGAKIVSDALRAHGANVTSIKKISFLISHHDDTAEEVEKLGDQELNALVAADSLSWLNFSAPNYFNGRESKGIEGLNDKMLFMLRKLPAEFWGFLPKIKLSESKILPFLKENCAKIADERGLPHLSFD